MLNLNTSQITVVSGNVDTLNGQAGSYYLNRSNHTGTQAISTIDNLQTELDLKLDAADYNDRFLGLYASFFDLVAAHPTASAGDYAQVDLGIGSDVIIYAWDDDDEQWAAVGSSAIANTDALPEGSTNLYHTSQRVRDTTITGFTATISAIISTDNVVQAFGKAQGQINAISGINSDRTLLYTTPTPKKPILLTDFSERIFDTDYTFPANSLAVGDIYELDIQIVNTRLSATGSQSIILQSFINGAANAGGASSTTAASIGAVTVQTAIFYFVVGAIGVSGKLSCGGTIRTQNGQFSSHGANFGSGTYNTTQDITLNVAVRLSIALVAGDTHFVQSARLFKLNNAS